MAREQHRALAVTAVVGGLYGIHTLFAWKRTKALARRLMGRHYDSGYRFFYTVQSFATAFWGLCWFLRQPDAEIYHLRGPWKLLGRGLQLCGLLLLFDVVRIFGPTRMLGIRQLVAGLLGRQPPLTPEAQGPPPRPDGQLDLRGSFRHIRHPDNLPAVFLFFGFPRMTWNRLALAATTLAYAVIGSLHEDRRLREAYGVVFERYERAVPLIVPRVRLRLARGRGIAYNTGAIQAKPQSPHV